MMTINIYTDIDTLFDTRRGILEHMAKEANIKSFKWSDYEPYYKNRNMDYFEAPEFGFTHAEFLKRFSERSVDDWVDEDTCYFYPSNVLPSILPAVRSLEYGTHQTIQFNRLCLTINTYPFELSDELAEQLKDHIIRGFKVSIDVKLVHISFEKQTAQYINSFQYVFRYGHLINQEFKTWYDGYVEAKATGTKFIVPSLLAKHPTDSPELEILNTDSVKGRIEKMSAIQGGKVVFVPLDKEIFDYCDM